MKERSPNLIFYQKGDVSSISLTATFQGLHGGKTKRNIENWGKKTRRIHTEIYNRIKSELI